MRKWLNLQQRNRFLFVPFLMAAGAALYFSLTTEPNLFFPGILSLIFITLATIKKIPTPVRVICIFAFGFCYANTYTNLINTPIIKRNLYNLTINGPVQKIDFTDDKNRIFLRINAEDIKAGTGDAIVRLSVGNDIALPQIGDVVSANVGLFKPSGAAAPETFDYARWAYFNNLSATGYTNDIQIIKNNRKYSLNKFRDNIHNKTNSFLVDSLVLGYKNIIPENDAAIWVSSGIGHVWSISGFHMTLVGGWLFLIFYTLFRAVPWVVRRVPAKIPGILCAWIGLVGYLFLSGCDVATIRAFLMTSLVFMAFIFGRSAFSMRNIALAFCAIFLINPHYVMQAGFQLSFAAVFGLIWVYSEIKPKMPENKILKIIYAMVLTSLVATLFTAPFVAAHFGTLPTYSLIGNLVLLPIFSIAIMPLVMIGTITGMFGILFPIELAHLIYDKTLNIARCISELPLANIDMPHIPNNAMICFIAGLMSLVLIQNIKIKVNCILFALFVGIGIVLVQINPKPIFWTTDDNELVAFVDDNGKLEFNKSRSSNHYFAFKTWKKFNGEATNTPNKRRKHDKGLYRYNDIVYIQKFVPLMNNIKSLCNDDSVRYIVSYFDIKSEKCKHKILRGGFVIYPDGRVKYTTTKRRWN